MKRLTLLSRNYLYAVVLVYLFIVFVWVVITSESVHFFEGDFYPNLFRLILTIFWGIFFIYASELLRTFGYSPKLILGTRISFFFCAMVGYILANPLLEYAQLDFSVYFFLLFHIFSFGFLAVVLVAILADVFGSVKTEPDHIWGAVVCYFLGILLFADVYEIISLIKPGYLGEMYPRGLPNYIECILFSINAATGLDSLYPEALGLFKKIANIENLLANLFLIVVLGRLLSTPLKKGS